MAINYEAAFEYFIFMCGFVSMVAGMFSFLDTLCLYLPLPQWVPAIATLLSIIALVTSITVDVINRAPPAKSHNSHRLRNTILSVIDQLHSVLTAIIATIALTYIFPENILLFRMEQQWQAYFESRNVKAIRAIQDRFKCCGLLNTKDRAWPLKDHNYGDDTCQLQLGYQGSCLVPWSKAQRFTSWLVFAAVMVAWGMKLVFIYFGPHPSSWMTSFFSSRKSADYQQITAQPKPAEKDGENVNDKGSE